MIEMHDLRERLRRAGDHVSPPEEAFERLVERRRRRQRNGRIAAGAVALALTGAILGGLLVVLGGRETRLTPGGSGLGAPDEGGQSLAVGPGQSFYERSVVIVPDAEGFEPGTAEVETWCSADGSCRIEAHSDTPSYGVPPSGAYRPGEYPVEDLSGLSTDPSLLAGQLRDRSAPGGASPQPEVTPEAGQSPESGGLWRAVTDLLETPNALPELRAAIFEVAADIPGVEVLEEVVDPVDREALALRIYSEGAERILYFDPDTLQFMAGEEDIGGGPVWYRIVLQAGIVGSTSEPPEGHQLLFPEPRRALPSPGGPG